MRVPPPHPRRDLAAGLAAATGLLVILVGVPTALATAVGWPLPRAMPSVDSVVTAMRYGQIAPTTLLRGVAVVAWIAWALVVVSITLEAGAVVRGSLARALPGLRPMQQFAGHLVATVMLVSSVATRAAAEPPPVPPASWPVAEPVADERPPHAEPAGPAAPRAQVAQTWTVRRRDSLWMIAERTLGDGHRWKEIAAINVDRVQPGGGRLRRGDTLIRPGWRLELPADARIASAPEQVTVAKGDDLWGLAEQHLYDGARWREIYARNRGRTQADGGRLDDPDVIEPGWILQLPDDDRRADRPRGTAHHDREAGTPGDGDTAVVTGQDDGHRVDPVTGTGVRAPDDSGAGAQRNADDAEAARIPVPVPVTPSTLPGAPAARRSHMSNVASPPLARHTVATPAGHRVDASTLRPDAADLLPVATGMLAAGLVGLLAHRRRHWLRRRGTGAVLDPVDPEAAELERWLRSMADHDLAHTIDRVLCVLTERFSEHGVAPRVAAVEFGEQIAVRLVTAGTDPPAGFTSTDDGRRWILPPELGMAPPHGDDRYVPALVSCGLLANGALLQLDPTAAAGVGVVGDSAHVHDAMTSWTTELAAGGAAAGVDIVVVGRHHPLLERLARVSVAADATAALDRVHRLRDDAEDAGARVVVLCGPGPSAVDIDALVAVARHDGVGVVVFGPDVGATLVELADDRVRLTPDGVWIDAPEWLSPDDWDRFGDLLRQTGHEHVVDPVPPTLRPVAAIDRHDTIAPTADLDADARVVGVLGPLTLDGRRMDVDRDAGALLAYLAIDRTGGTPDSLHRMLWPGLSRDAIPLDPAVAAVDATFGGDGAAVVRTDDGRLELRDSVTTDLARWRELLRDLDRLPPPAQARRMYAALQLVRGRPFASFAPWAHADGSSLRLAGMAIDVAHRLAMQSLTIGDTERATWAVERGLLAAPTSELLHRDRMQIADATGDVAWLESTMRELRVTVEADGGWLTDETEELYRRLRGTPPDVEEDVS